MKDQQMTTIFGSVFTLDKEEVLDDKWVNFNARKVITKLKLSDSLSRKQQQECFGERWATIRREDGSDGNFEVSNTGIVRNKLTHNVLEIRVNTYGYRYVICNGESLDFDTRLVHRLVATYFVKQRKNEQDVVNHIDEDVSNNNAWNLEWTTTFGNLIHGTAIERGAISRSDFKKSRALFKDQYDAINAAQIESKQRFNMQREIQKEARELKNKQLKIEQKRKRKLREIEAYERKQRALFEANKNGISQIFGVDIDADLSIETIVQLNDAFDEEMSPY